MAATQRLETLITINARTGNGFSKVGSTLTEMGSLVNGFSQQLIGLGKDSVQVYRSYEKSLKSAEVALSTTYGRDTADLAKVMKELDASATEWAATTIFHTNDVGNAISEAAHAGWDLEEILYGLPAAMELAQAGGLELSEAVNFIVKATSAAGIGFEDLTSFTDQWTFASNSSASNIREFGEAMLRMGSTMRFTGSTEELMTLIAVTANAGAVGTEAGTMIRNSMLRLLAPTEKAEKAMAMLGAASQETVDLMDDADLAASNLILTQHGFSAYDEQGNLKNILEIYRELYLALGEIAGGFDNIDRNQDAIRILSSIFPTRTITEAITLLRGAAEGYDGLYDAMRGGAAEGYGAYAAETMMDTLDGKIEIFESKVERLEQIIGEELRDDVIGAADWAGGLIDGLAEMDPAGFSALVSGLEVVAGAGPALLAAGGAMRLIGAALGGPVGWGAMALVGIGAGIAALSDLRESEFKANFGTMEMDMASIDGYIHSIGDGFREAYEEANEFRDAVNGALKGYEEASGSLSSSLMSKMLTKAELTSADKRELERLADEMYDSLTDAINNSASATQSYWTQLFSLGNGDFDEAYQQIIDLTNQASAEALLEAEGISQDFRSALNSAFADGEISPEEYQNILAYMNSYNDAMARAAAEAKSEEDFVRMQGYLHKAQTVSWDEAKEIIDEAMTDRDQILKDQEDAYLEERFRMEYRWDRAIQEGWLINGALATEEGKIAALEEADTAFKEQQNRTSAAYDELILDLYETTINQSDLAENFQELGEIADRYRSGELFSTNASLEIIDRFGRNTAGTLPGLLFPNETNAMYEAMHPYVRALGGEKGVMEKIAYYRQAGEMEMAERLSDLLVKDALLDVHHQFMGMYGLDDVEEMEEMLGIEYNQLYGDYKPQGHTRENSLVTKISWNPEGNTNTGVKIYRGAEAEEMLAALEAQHPEIELQGNFDALDAGLAERDGQSITVNVEENPTGAVSNGRPRIVKGTNMKEYAEGGRATQPSIFGDAGAEWAIPEEHSERTAALLNAARAASGWSWPDLLARFGGLNASAGHTPTTIVYSPTIHAQDAAGVEEALRRDKKRLEKWMEDMKARDAAEVYR